MLGTCYSVEAAYQSNMALLLGNVDVALQLLDPNLRPEQAQQMGRQLRRNLSPEEQVWLQEVKPHVMRPLLHQKFAIDWLQVILLRTGELRLMKAGADDRYWGVGLTAEQIRARDEIPPDALNWMGRLLEEVRMFYGSEVAPRRHTLIIGDKTVAGFLSATQQREPFTLLCRPGASLTYLLTLAEACACPTLRHVIVGGGYLLPAVFADQPVPTSRSMACAVADTVGRFRGLAPYLTYFPPVTYKVTPKEVPSKLAAFYDDLAWLLPRYPKGQPQTFSFIDLSDMEVSKDGPFQEEPSLPGPAHIVVKEHIKNTNERIETQTGQLCSCNEYWCVQCFNQAHR